MPAVKKVVTAKEYAAEEAFVRGENDQKISFEEPMLATPLPSSMPYAIMFDEDCDTEFL